MLTLAAMALLLLPGLMPLPEAVLPVVAVCAGLALGTSRTPRDVMLKDACPPGQIGKVFGFVSSGLPLGSAITPVPLGFLIDMGHPGPGAAGGRRAARPVAALRRQRPGLGPGGAGARGGPGRIAGIWPGFSVACTAGSGWRFGAWFVAARR